MAKHVITNAAEITILELIDTTYKTGGGPVSVGATVVIANKGPVGTVTQVIDANWKSVFGSPFSKKADGMEGLRHLADAAKECNYINVVRCVSADARYPSMLVAKVAGTGEDPDTSSVTKTATAYGTDLADLGANDLFNIRVIDGDPSTSRKMTISNIDTTKKRFKITITDVDSLGATYTLESYTVGIDPTDKDDMGLPAYIEYVFESNSDRFRVNWNEDIAWAAALEALQDLQTDSASAAIAFTGGTNGSYPTVAERQAAWELLRNDKYIVNLMFAAGEYDADVLATIADIADERHCSAFIDAPPGQKHDDAIDWLTGTSGVGIKSRHVRCYHSPYSANDPWMGGKTVWGVSGAAAAAKARGNANFTGVVPGIHYSPAGTKRGFINRTGMAPLFPDDIVNRDDLYDARINPVVFSNNGGAFIDDDLTLHYESNYSRFGWVNDIVDYTEARFLEAAAAAKHEPDGLTRMILWDLTKAILDELVTSGALVTPRDTSAGKNPYILTVEQKEIDLWHVQWDICPTGSARRIAGQPKLIR
jgi:hypothetical protein